MAVIVNGDGILTGISSLATSLTDITSGRGTVTGVATVGTLQLGAGVSISSPRSQQAAIFTNNTEFLTVDDAGRVGVGTITPNSDAHPENEKKINVGFITAKSIAGDIDARNVVVAGISTFSGDVSIAQNIIHTGDTDTKIHFSAADQISFDTGGTTRLNITSAGNLEMPNDNDYIKIGASGDLQLVHNGTHSFITNSQGTLVLQSDALSITNQAGNSNRIISAAAGNVSLCFSDSVKLKTTGSGVDVSGTLNVTGVTTITNTLTLTNDLFMLDGDQIELGTDNDLKIFHSGFTYLEAHNDTEIHINAYTGGSQENMAKFKPNGAVELYHNGSKRLETTSSGNKASFSGPNTLIVGSTNAGGAHLVLDGDSNGDGSGADYSGISHESDGNMLIYQDNPNSNGKIDFNTGGSSRYSMQSDKFRPSNDNACTLGTSGLTWANVFTKGSYVIKGAGGTGVDFAHSASEGTAANILDEYEEGSWTPGFYPLSSAMTIGYDLQTGTYRRIGNVVYWAFRVRLQSLSGQMGQNMGFGGFPYTVDSSQPQFSANIYGSTYSGEIPNGIFYNGNTTYGELFYPSGSGGYANLQAADLNTGNSYTVGTGFYFAA